MSKLMIPTRRLVYLGVVCLLLSLVASYYTATLIGWQFLIATLAIVVLIDFSSLVQRKKITVSREVMSALSLGSWISVTLRFHNPATQDRQIDVYDHYPENADFEDLPLTLVLPANGWGEVQYRIKPLKRGDFNFNLTQIRIHSLMGFWKRNRLIGEPSSVRVYPNFAAVMKYTLLAMDQRLSQIGIIKKRRRGEGQDFHQLREYREGDSLRQVDWKATSRLHKLISRDYQEERDQQIIFLVDCGRRMLSEDGKLTHFDHTLNAILLLSHVALRQGDAVGLMTFSGEERWMSPRKSISSINHILNTIYDLQPGSYSPDYTNAASKLMIHQRRRALVVLITNLRDEDTEDLMPAIKIMQKRHLVLLASLKEKVIDDMMQKPVTDFDSAIDHAAAQQYAKYRRQTHQRLDHEGVLHLDVNPEQLPVTMVNHYMDIKSSGRL